MLTLLRVEHYYVVTVNNHISEETETDIFGNINFNLISYRSRPV